ncbi:hypothetical protein WA026_007101 [Henosepilachna vigintioctopunctata]|uniref:Transcription initiation factor IIA subunit 1 n=1 Tax=Henosepilachna vigintioctopunctata TaxID=420089 RepID=A0AAW1V9B3_9CUCU
MSNSLCKNSVSRVYQEVIDDVISGVRELFLEEGVDEQVLQELKQTWEAKLVASKAVQNEQEEKAKQKQEINSANGFPKQMIPQVVNQHNTMQPQPQITQVVETKMVPIQITLPPQPGTEGQRILTIQVPATALQGNQLQKVLTGPVITATMGLPANIASSLLQQHVNAAFSSQQQSVTIVKQNIVQSDGQSDLMDDCTKLEFIILKDVGKAVECSSSSKRKINKSKHQKKNIAQCDGAQDTSDDDEDASEDNDEDDDDLDEEKDEDNDMEDEGGEEEPLNSEDDVTDEDPSDLFETDNIVVCQYDKIIRNRNKWKFYLKDGIMNLSGQDYVFQKANGDAEW